MISHASTLAKRYGNDLLGAEVMFEVFHTGATPKRIGVVTKVKPGSHWPLESVSEGRGFVHGENAIIFNFRLCPLPTRRANHLVIQIGWAKRRP